MQIHPANASAEIAHAVRDARRAEGLRQEELALAAGVSTKTLHNLEGGTSGLRVDTLLRILQVLGLRLDVTPRAQSMPVWRERLDRSSEDAERSR